MAGFTRRMAERIMDATVKVERTARPLSGRRRKYPVGGGGTVKVFRIDGGDLYNGQSASGVPQRWNKTTESFGDRTGADPRTLYADFTFDYYFEDMLVEAKKIGGRWQVISGGRGTIEVTLPAALWSLSPVLITSIGITVNAAYSPDYYHEGEDCLVEFVDGFWQVISSGHSSVRGVLDGNLASGSTATMSVWVQDEFGDWSDSGDNLTVRPWSTTLNETITSGTKVLAEQLGPGIWSAKIDECPTPP